VAAAGHARGTNPTLKGMIVQLRVGRGFMKICGNVAEEGHCIHKKEAKAVQTETDINRKYKEAFHIACITNQISQTSLEIFPIFIALIDEQVGRLQRSSL
jgi:hypothetical protein